MLMFQFYYININIYINIYIYINISLDVLYKRDINVWWYYII